MSISLLKYTKAMLMTGYDRPDRLKYCTDLPLPPVEADEGWRCRVNNTNTWPREGSKRPMRSDSRESLSRFHESRVSTLQVELSRWVQILTAIALGQRVLVDPVLRRPADRLYGAGHYGSERDDGFAQFVAAPADNAFEVE